MEIVLRYLILLVVLSFFNDLKAQGKEAYLLLIYEYDSDRLSSKDEVKVFGYYQLFPDGKFEYTNKNGCFLDTQIDSKLYAELDSVTKSGLESFRNKLPPRPNRFYAGYYSFLMKGNQALCFNPYDINQEIKAVLLNIEAALEQQKIKYKVEVVGLEDEIIQKLKSTHDMANLSPIASPPPMKAPTK